MHQFGKMGRLTVVNKGRVSMHRILTIALVAFISTQSYGADSLPQSGDVAVQRLSEGIRFTIVTPHGYVGFDARADWPVLAMQSFLPITVTAFQIPDPADVQTKDSTNLAVSLFQQDADSARQRLSTIKEQGESAGTPEHYKGWTIYRRDANQGATRYTVVDALAPTADVICGVRLAWPHLSTHTAGYDAKMEALLRATLDSVQGALGPYQLHRDEILRRPNK
jgi:hypothetical protein